MLGLTVRWSLRDAAEGTADALADYVASTSHAKFTGQNGLRFKTWRVRPGEWFEGCYVFTTEEARERFQAAFAEDADDAPGSRIVGAPPILIEECEIVAVAQGWDGFLAAARFEASSTDDGG